MKIKIGKLCLDFDRDYGCDKRTGWSIAWDGHYTVQLERFFLVAVFKAIFMPE